MGFGLSAALRSSHRLVRFYDRVVSLDSSPFSPSSLRIAATMLKKKFAKIREKVSAGRLLKRTETLWQLERGQTFDDYHRSALHAEALMLEAGLSRVERIAFPADGRTAYHDKIMPLAWRASVGRLEISSARVAFADPVVADFARHPFHLIRGSVSTPPGGCETRLILEEDVYLGVDPAGAMVLLNPEAKPSFANIRAMVERNVLGIVSDNLTGRYRTPEGLQWVTGFTEGPSWHTCADSRPLIGFSVTPCCGDQLREALRAGPVTVNVISDGERYEDTVDVVTGTIPGSDPREVWLMAHLYEPLPDDNSTGVACAIEVAQVIQSILKEEGCIPRFTLRVVCGLEMYGFSAYAAARGTNLRDQVLCALNLDALPVMRGHPAQLLLSPPGSPSFAEFSLEKLARSGLAVPPQVTDICTEGEYCDDLLLGDSTVGIPTFWLRVRAIPGATIHEAKLWHNSAKGIDMVDPDYFRNYAALAATWAMGVLRLDPKAVPSEIASAARISDARLVAEYERLLELADNSSQKCRSREADFRDDLDFRFQLESARLRDFERVGDGSLADQELRHLSARLEELKQKLAFQTKGEGIERSQFDGTFWRVAEAIIVARRSLGLPHDLAAAPWDRHRVRSGSFTSGPLASVLANCDGKENLAELLRRAQWERMSAFSDPSVRSAIDEISVLADHGYLDLDCSAAMPDVPFSEVLSNAGIRAGDVVMIDARPPLLGSVFGGATALLDSILSVLGPEGTLLMPTFTHSILSMDGVPLKDRKFFPFHPQLSPITTGEVAEAFRNHKGVVQGIHVSHSFVGMGPLAQSILGAHCENAPPFGKESPLVKIAKLGGKFVYLGSDFSDCVFFALLNHLRARPAELKTALCMVQDDCGSRRLVLADGYLFDSPTTDNTAAQITLGHDQHSTRFQCGCTELHVVEAKQ